MARAYGSGSKRERRKGVWELRAAGHTATFRGTGKEAELELAKMVARFTNRTGVSAATFGELIDEWLAGAQIERSTRTTYEYALAHLPAKVRAMKLSKLGLRTFDRLYADLLADGVSSNQVRKLHTVLSAALTEGVRWQWLDVHPARGARLPAIADPKITPPSAEQLSRLLSAARSSGQMVDEVWITLALAVGARRGELLALRWSDVDLDGSRVTISSSLEEDRTVKASTKTNKARVVRLDDDTVALLRRWRSAQVERALAVPGTTLAKNPWILSNELDSGTSWRPDGATQRFRRLCARAKVSGVRLHDLRHAHVALLQREGVRLDVISPRVGHDQQSTTSDMYGYLFDDEDANAADAIGRALRKLA